MSSWREQKVLRMPAATAGMHTMEEWYAFRDRHRPALRWDPGCFAPALCSFKHGAFLDYILSDRAPIFGDGAKKYARSLTDFEKEKYLPVFQTLFPDFTLEQMEDVHYCEYSWYDGTEAPDCY